MQTLSSLFLCRRRRRRPRPARPQRGRARRCAPADFRFRAAPTAQISARSFARRRSLIIGFASLGARKVGSRSAAGVVRSSAQSIRLSLVEFASESVARRSAIGPQMDRMGVARTCALRLRPKSEQRAERRALQNKLVHPLVCTALTHSIFRAKGFRCFGSLRPPLLCADRFGPRAKRVSFGTAPSAVCVFVFVCVRVCVWLYFGQINCLHDSCKLARARARHRHTRAQTGNRSRA